MPSESEKEINHLLREGHDLLQSRDLPGARACFIKVLELDEENLQALNNLGFIHYFLEEFEQGVQICQRAIALHPEDAYAHKGLGLHLAKLGYPGDAVECLKKAIRLNPDFVDAYHDLAFVLYENERIEEAKDYLREGLRHATTEETTRLIQKFLNQLENMPPQ